jgi:hypothetical protein
MHETIISLIEGESENTKLDFKLEQYPIDKGNAKKGEFLKDMCAFANLSSKDDKHIIIGIEEKNGTAAGFKSIAELNDQASYQQFLNQYIEPEINFEYKELVYQENRLAYFRIFDNNKGPYLFKKEYKDAQPKGSHYRTGTGFIRSGSSTRELRREDFEKIYAERSAIKDRSEDIDFNVRLGGFKSSDLSRAGYIKHLQIDVLNVSNTSIDIDVEVKVYNNRGVSAECAQDLEHKLYKGRKDNSLMAYSGNFVPSPFIFVDTNVNFNKYANHSIYEIMPKRGTHTSLRVKQKGKQTDIFNGQIALVFSRPTEVKIEIIVRSNDFTDGLKTFTCGFSIEDTQKVLDPFDL